MQEKKSLEKLKEAYAFIVNLINDNNVYNTSVRTVGEAQENLKFFINENKMDRDCEILDAADCANLYNFDSEKLAKIYKYIKKVDEEISLEIVGKINFNTTFVDNSISSSLLLLKGGMLRSVDLSSKKNTLLKFIEKGSLFRDIPVLKSELFQNGKVLSWDLFSIEEENKKMSYKNIKRILNGDQLDDMQKIVDYLKSAPKNEVNALFEASMSERNKKFDGENTQKDRVRAI